MFFSQLWAKHTRKYNQRKCQHTQIPHEGCPARPWAAQTVSVETHVFTVKSNRNNDHKQQWSEGINEDRICFGTPPNKNSFFVNLSTSSIVPCSRHVRKYNIYGCNNLIVISDHDMTCPSRAEWRPHVFLISQVLHFRRKHYATFCPLFPTSVPPTWAAFQTTSQHVVIWRQNLCAGPYIPI